MWRSGNTALICIREMAVYWFQHVYDTVTFHFTVKRVDYVRLLLWKDYEPDCVAIHSDQKAIRFLTEPWSRVRNLNCFNRVFFKTLEKIMTPILQLMSPELPLIMIIWWWKKARFEWCSACMIDFAIVYSTILAAEKMDYAGFFACLSHIMIIRRYLLLDEVSPWTFV